MKNFLRLHLIFFTLRLIPIWIFVRVACLWLSWINSNFFYLNQWSAAFTHRLSYVTLCSKSLSRLACSLQGCAKRVTALPKLVWCSATCIHIPHKAAAFLAVSTFNPADSGLSARLHLQMSSPFFHDTPPNWLSNLSCAIHDRSWHDSPDSVEWPPQKHLSEESKPLTFQQRIVISLYGSKEVIEIVVLDWIAQEFDYNKSFEWANPERK